MLNIPNIISLEVFQILFYGNKKYKFLCVIYFCLQKHINVPYSAVYSWEEILDLSTSSPLVKAISEFLSVNVLLSLLVKKSHWIT